jgi:hypothetical protein
VTALGPCRDCGQTVIRPRSATPLNVRGVPLTHNLTCPARAQELPLTADTFSSPDVLPEPQGDLHKIKRNQWGQPLIVPPGGGRAVGYQRVTTFIKPLEDTHGLQNWMKRQVAVGLSMQENLRRAVDAHGPGYLNGDEDDKKTLDAVCEQAMAAADSKGKATLGTALHRLTERLDRGDLTLADVPDWAKPDCAEYLRITDGFQWLHIERMHVNDELRVAGTPDRIALIDGQETVVDLKTGSFYASSCAAQLGIYANSHRYDIATCERIPTGYRRDRGLVVHLPAGSGQARLRWVDIGAGYDIAKRTCCLIREWRKRRDLDLGDYAPPAPAYIALAGMAASIDDLMRLYERAVAEGQWNDELKAVFAARKRELQGAAA